MLRLPGKLNTVDAFRARHGADKCEYTHTETAHGRARRIDQIHVSSAADNVGAIPELTRCQHVHHGDTILARHLKPAPAGQHEDRHSAVTIELCLSAKPAPPPRWRFDNSRLLTASVRESLRGIIQACIGEGGTATEQLQRIAARVQTTEKAAARAAQIAQRNARQRVERTIQRVRNNLGLGLRGAAAIPPWMSHPGRRQRELDRLRAAQAELAIMLANEQRKP